MVAPELGYGGTIDLVCRIGKEIWMLDLKTANYLHNSYELQVAAYQNMWNYLNPDMKIQRSGIFWFKAQTRGADKTGKSIQGEGWQVKEYEGEWLDALDLFNSTFKIWKHENPNAKPKNKVYPISISLV